MTTEREIGDELYTLPPHAFTAARDLRVAEARQTGDKALATALAALKRPTVSAWLANLVALRRPDAVAALIHLGQTIRTAQGSVTGAQLRDLSAQRRREIDTVVTIACDLVAAAGEPEPGKQYLTELEGTLAAAMADPAAAVAVQRGRTLKPLSYSGFGTDAGAGDDGLAAALAASLASAPTADPRTDHRRAEAQAYAEAQAEAEQAERELRRQSAQTRLDEATQVLAAASETEQLAEAQVQQLTDELARVKESLEIATREARTARQARIAAEREQATAYRRLARTDR